MRIGEICTVQTVHCKRDLTVQGAALLMRNHHVGDLVEFLAEEMGELSRISSRQLANEKQFRQ